MKNINVEPVILHIPVTGIGHGDSAHPITRWHWIAVRVETVSINQNHL